MTTPKRQFLISACLGFLVTLLGAWLTAMFGSLNSFMATNSEPVQGLDYPAYVPGPWKHPDERWTYSEVNPAYKLVGLTTTTRSTRGNPVVGVGHWSHRFGWPLHAWQYVEMTIAPGPGMPTDAETIRLLEEFDSRAGWRRGIKLPAWLGLPDRAGGRILPPVPIWSGLAVDWTLDTIAAWTLLFLPGVLIRKRRFHRGLCLNCGYPLGSNTCSECGHAHAARLIPSS